MSDAGRGAPAPTRTVVVAPLSSRKEAILVARALFHIVFWSAVVIAIERQAGETAQTLDTPVAAGAPRTSAPVGEVTPAELPARDRQLFAQVETAVPALESARAGTGSWPPIDDFGAPDYRWRILREGVVTNYVGVPKAADRNTFNLVFVEPERGVPSDPQAAADEIHHRLPDGTLLHVTLWIAPGKRELKRPLAAPAPEDGWQRITRKTR